MCPHVAERHHRFKAATTLPSIKLATPEKMLCDFMMERCVGHIISLADVIPVQDGQDAGQDAVVPYQYNPSTLVDQACEAAVVLAGRGAQAMTAQHRNHTFYQVLKGDLHRRFLAAADELRQWQMAVKRLELCGRAGTAGVFRASGHIEYLNIRECLGARSVTKFLEGLHVWQCTQSSWLRIVDVHASTPGSGLSSLAAGTYGGMQLNVYRSRSSEALLESILEQLLSCNGLVFWYDTVAQKIMGDQGSFSLAIDEATLQLLQDIGAVIKYESVLGDFEFRVNPRSVQWMETLDLTSGCADPTTHVRSDLRGATKLALMMLLRGDGWLPQAGVDVHTPASSKRYRHILSKSRWYFVALAECAHLFSMWSSFAEGGEDLGLPYISHSQNEAYYKAFFFYMLYFISFVLCSS